MRAGGIKPSMATSTASKLDEIATQWKEEAETKKS